MINSFLSEDVGGNCSLCLIVPLLGCFKALSSLLILKFSLSTAVQTILLLLSYWSMWRKLSASVSFCQAWTLPGLSEVWRGNKFRIGKELEGLSPQWWASRNTPSTEERRLMSAPQIILSIRKVTVACHLCSQLRTNLYKD